MGRKRRLIDIRGFGVMKQPCGTCPFTTDSLGPESTAPYVENIVTFGSQHVCHSVDRMICRGGRDLMLRTMAGIGLIDEPTDEAFERKSREVLHG